MRLGPLDAERAKGHVYVALGWRRWIGVSVAWGRRDPEHEKAAELARVRAVVGNIPLITRFDGDTITVERPGGA